MSERSAGPETNPGGNPEEEPRREVGNDSDNQSDSARLSGLIIGFTFYLFLGGLLIWNSNAFRAFALRNIWLLAGLFLVIVGTLVVAWVKQDLLTASAKKQIGIIIFVAIPLLLILVGTVFFLPPGYQVNALRTVFLLIVCLLPAFMYYLFIASRKSSLLQEYFTNLARLGLFERQELATIGHQPALEPEFERRLRVMSYIQKFEAAYGPIPEPFTQAILDATDPDAPTLSLAELQRGASGVGGYFSPETVIPVVLATMLIGLGWLITLPPWEIIDMNATATETTKLAHVLLPQPIPVHFAFLGAYFFSLQMLFRRFVRKDLRANAYLAVTLRILLAVLGTWIVLQASKILGFAGAEGSQALSGLLVVSFVIGAFPPVAWQVIQAAFRVVTGARYLVPSLQSTMPVSDLDGLTVWHQARLEEEDIENIPNMASADIVELMLNTRIPPERIVDWVDQAILYTQLGNGSSSRSETGERIATNQDRRLLRSHGIRTASTLLYAYQQSEDRQDIDQYEAILPGQGRSRMRSLADTLCNNPNLVLVQRWRR